MPNLIAKEFTVRLMALQSNDELKKHQRYFKFVADDQGSDDYFIGVRMGQVFELAKEFIDMPPDEIEKLMKSPIHEVRAGAMSIMGQCAKGKVILALSAESREAVDEMVAKAVAARGTAPNDKQDRGFMYGWGYQDLTVTCGK